MICSKLLDNVYQLKINDFSASKMHTFQLNCGTSYNAYLVKEQDESVLIDTVPAQFAEQFLELISEIVNLDELKYIVINHTEADSSGALPVLLEHLNNPKIFCTKKCAEFLPIMYSQLAGYTNFEIVDAKYAFELSNSTTIKFLPTPLLHWQEQMTTYLENNLIFFTSDLYSQNIASAQLFGDEIEQYELLKEGKLYLTEVFGALESELKKAYEITEIAKLICPQHGLVLRNTQVQLFRDFYENFHLNEHLQNKISIFYDQMYGSTQKMAIMLSDEIKETGYAVRLFDLQHDEMADCILSAFESKYIAIGSPTLNYGCLPRINELLSYFNANQIVNGKSAIVFGAFGWSAGSCKEITDELMLGNCTIVEEISWRLESDGKDIESMKLAIKKLFG